jgi:hypothetical protein
MALLDRVQDRSMLAKTLHVVRTHVNPFVEPLGESVEHERRVFSLGMDTGDLEYAAWALHIQVAHAFYAGHALEGLHEMYAQHRSVLERHQQLPALGCTLPYGQTIANLRGAVDDPTRLVGPDYDEDEHMEELTAVGFRGAAYILTVARTFVRLLFRDLAGARQAADAGAALADGAIATYHQVWWHQYRTLATLGAMEPGGEVDAEALEDVRGSLARLEAWCGFSEANHRHRVELVRAELARVEGRDADARSGYEAAAASAREHGFLHEEALAHELAARFHLSRESPTEARAHLQQAREAYAEWGAAAKVAHLEAELGEVLGPPHSRGS